MSADALAALVARVASFHITDRAMRKAQDAAQQALANGGMDAAQERAYLAAVRRYFEGFEREARGHLRDVDKRLEHVNQMHFNLIAERGVAVKRIEATQAVLADLDGIGTPS